VQAFSDIHEPTDTLKLGCNNSLSLQLVQELASVWNLQVKQSLWQGLQSEFPSEPGP